MMASRTSTNDRINEAVALLLAGRSASGIVSEMADKHGVTRRQARRYVGRGYEIIRDDIDAADVDREKLVSQLVNSLQESLAKAAAAGHTCAVVSCCRELRELLGLAADAKPRQASPTPYRIGHGS
jgi:uncharacterized FAD-dependent dehydrogenase